MSFRTVLLKEIKNIILAFDDLFEIPVEAYNLPSENPASTIGEVFYHMSLVSRMMEANVKMFKGGWLIRLVSGIIPKGLFNWLNMQLTRFGRRKAT